ncbi:ceramidase [Ascoidea rubescens DSM 1968]|uniref:Alkaline phytoceramidase n=1 Tax=Ascoidea rubescens DSM 1968 TaxID=1344418 RepID=A0A1D2VLR2_9ASCO|nr:alkaline phytoceramidase [Ascoidea rubescens DSM 1968]ODV62541.1 alkaline phytoceramidase [Ascoidea rubescens DSM 1968]
MLPFAIEYPTQPFKSYWGKPTSSIEFCEENNVISPYIAEFINTLTNSLYIAVSIYSMYSTHKNKLEKRFQLTFFLFCVVGIGSWLFHMTLLYHYQLLDELPMVYATCVPFWSLYSSNMTLRNRKWFAGTLVSVLVVLTLIYIELRNSIYQQVAYALLNVLVVYKSYQLTKKVDRLKYQKQWNHLYRSMMIGVWTFNLGFLCWNLDNIYCDFFIELRRQVGLPYGMLIEGHGWWHIFTGIGVYNFVIFLEFLRCFEIGVQDQYALIWHCKCLPEVVLKTNVPQQMNKSKSC